jgi:hypothetical protein
VLYLEHTWIHVSLKYNSFNFPCQLWHSIFIFTKPTCLVSSLYTTTLNVPFNIYAVHTLKNIKALRNFVASLSPVLTLCCLYRWTINSHKQSCFNLYFCQCSTNIVVITVILILNLNNPYVTLNSSLIYNCQEFIIKELNILQWSTHKSCVCKNILFADPSVLQCYTMPNDK